jgi:hypothetical protein
LDKRKRFGGLVWLMVGMQRWDESVSATDKEAKTIFLDAINNV